MHFETPLFGPLSYLQYSSRVFCLKHSPTAFIFPKSTHHRDRGGSGVIKNAVFRGGHGVGAKNPGKINTNTALDT